MSGSVFLVSYHFEATVLLTPALLYPVPHSYTSCLTPSCCHLFPFRREQWKLLSSLKTTVEGLVSTNNPNVWSRYGGLQRLHKDMNNILSHGLKNEQVSTSDWHHSPFCKHVFVCADCSQNEAQVGQMWRSRLAFVELESIHLLATQKQCSLFCIHCTSDNSTATLALCLQIAHAYTLVLARQYKTNITDIPV